MEKKRLQMPPKAGKQGPPSSTSLTRYFTPLPERSGRYPEKTRLDLIEERLDRIEAFLSGEQPELTEKQKRAKKKQEALAHELKLMEFLRLIKS